LEYSFLNIFWHFYIPSLTPRQAFSQKGIVSNFYIVDRCHLPNLEATFLILP
jgi:hypothetical protein